MRLFTVLSVVGGVFSDGLIASASASGVHGHRHTLSPRGSSTLTRGTELPARWKPCGLQHKSSDGAAKRSLSRGHTHKFSEKLPHRAGIDLPTAVGSEKLKDKIQVQLHWHVIHKGQTAQEGFLSTELIHRQIAVVNSIFTASGLPMNINLAQTTYTKNPTWFEYGGDFDSQTEREVIKNLRVGGAADVNVFTVRKPRDGQVPIMGYGTMPQQVHNFFYLDAIFLAFDALPGFSSEGGEVLQGKALAQGLFAHHWTGYGTMPQQVHNFFYLDAIFLAFDALPGFSSEGGEVLQGKALAHELGHHILGLLHTFEGGCSPINDGIADTPPQRYQTQGCEYNAAAQCQAGVPYVARGNDLKAKLSFNLMDYSNEACRGGLTPGQVAAGLENWYRYRAQNASMKG